MSLIDASVGLEFGRLEDWILSDHVPLIVDIRGRGPAPPKRG